MPAGLTIARPYPGLRPFGYDDREFYFGREDQVYALFRMLEYGRFVAVVGSSGSGKSSLVRAGLLPLLEKEAAEPGGRHWSFVEMRPGDHALRHLAAAIASLGPNDQYADLRRDSILNAIESSSYGLIEALGEIPGAQDHSFMIVVDQFEEIFRYEQAQGRDRARLFVQSLLEATRTKKYNIYVLITMRSDFIGECSRFYLLPEAVSASQFLVPGLTSVQRDDVIRQPAIKAGLPMANTLVQRLLVDAEAIPDDDLPVLQHGLARLWSFSRERDAAAPPSLEDYAAIGTLANALSQHADEVMSSPELQALGDRRELAVEMVFRALSERDREGRAIRRGRTFAQLVNETADGNALTRDDIAAVVKRFAADDCSFLVLSPSDAELDDGTIVDVGHEALLRRWTRISGGATGGGWLADEEIEGRWLRGLAALAGSRR